MFDEGETEEENQSNYNASYKVKFIIVGDSCVGKSNILLRFYQNRFDSNKAATIGMEFVSKHYIYNNTDYLIQIWDTAGQEKYKSVTRTYYKASAIAMIVYDITKKTSFENIKSWLSDCKEMVPSTALLVLIGNKNDLEDKRVIMKEEGENLAEENNMIFFETSALNGNGIQETFKKCIETIDQRIKSGYYVDLNDDSNHGIKLIPINNENNYSERVIDKEALAAGSNKKKKKKCCS